MNVYPPVSITPASTALTCLACLAWAGALVITVSDPTAGKMLAVSIGIGATATGSAVIVECTARLIRKMEEHAQRVEAATTQHANLLAKHVLALDRFFEMGIQSDRAARADAMNVRPWKRRDSGSFRVHNGDAG